MEVSGWLFVVHCAWLLAVCSNDMQSAGLSHTIALSDLTDAVQEPDPVLHV